ncbi:glycosyltransferase family 4 protein [Methylobacterium komagatae]|uniref:Glycosyltransferase family 4 protein n=1 Tax=Methylobacterium komagatae TaxID=374425 RepID=A0ABW2BH43_9HYPH
MRILHILNHGEDGNGHVNVAVDLASFQRQAGHAVAFAGSGGPYKPLLKQNGVDCYEFDLRRKSFKTALKALRDYVSLIRASKPDIVHAHMVGAALIAKLFQPVFGYKIVCTIHNSFDKQARLMSVGNRVVAVSEAVRKQMVARGIKPEKMLVIKNGVIGTHRLSPTFELKTLQKPAIGTVCGLHPRKGVQDLIKAFSLVAAKHPTSHLYVVGGGPMQSEYEELARETGFGDRIHFAGFQSDPRPYLYALDIFVLASHADPFPLAVLEARAAGCVMIGTNVDGIPEALDFGEAGLIAEPKDPENLAAQLDAVLSSADTREKLKEGSARTIDEFKLEKVSDRHLRLYSSLLGESPAHS